MAGKKTLLLSTLSLLMPIANASASVTESAVPLEVFGLPLTNSLITSWVTAILLIIVVRLMVGRPQLVPSKGQAVIEGVLTFLKDTTAPIVGKKAVSVSLPIITGLFFFIIVQNWSGLLPGVGSFGMGYEDPETGKFIVTQPFIRPGTSDANGTLALALVAMAAWLFICLKLAGPGVLIKDLFGNKAEKKEVGAAMWLALWPIFFLVGIIEVVSILIRPLTLSVRLFGNIFGGESLLHETGFVFPFYFLELMVGFVQPLVFILLFSVYVGLICNHGDGEEHH